MTEVKELNKSEKIIINRCNKKLLGFVLFALFLLGLTTILFFLFYIRYRRGESISGSIFGFITIAIIPFHLAIGRNIPIKTVWLFILELTVLIIWSLSVDKISDKQFLYIVAIFIIYTFLYVSIYVYFHIKRGKKLIEIGQDGVINRTNLRYKNQLIKWNDIKKVSMPFNGMYPSIFIYLKSGKRQCIYTAFIEIDADEIHEILQSNMKEYKNN